MHLPLTLTNHVLPVQVFPSSVWFLINSKQAWVETHVIMILITAHPLTLQKIFFDINKINFFTDILKLKKEKLDWESKGLESITHPN